jgi:CheY-like chemotaxis protein
VVQVSDGGRDAIEKFHAGKFDLVITDRAMADMSGDEVAATVRQSDANVPIIMVTGFGDIMNDDGQFPPGVNLVLAKPITHDVLREGIAKLMATRVKDPPEWRGHS